MRTCASTTRLCWHPDRMTSHERRDAGARLQFETNCPLNASSYLPICPCRNFICLAFATISTLRMLLWTLRHITQVLAVNLSFGSGHVAESCRYIATIERAGPRGLPRKQGVGDGGERGARGFWLGSGPPPAVWTTTIPCFSSFLALADAGRAAFELDKCAGQPDLWARRSGACEQFPPRLNGA